MAEPPPPAEEAAVEEAEMKAAEAAGAAPDEKVGLHSWVFFSVLLWWPVLLVPCSVTHAGESLQSPPLTV